MLDLEKPTGRHNYLDFGGEGEINKLLREKCVYMQKNQQQGIKDFDRLKFCLLQPIWLLLLICNISNFRLQQTIHFEIV